MNTRAKLLITVCIAVTIIGAIYVIAGIWYYNYGREPNYEEFDKDGNSFPAILKYEHEISGDRFQSYEQKYTFVGYQPTLYPEWMEGRSLIMRLWRPLGIVLSPIQWPIQLIRRTPKEKIVQYTMVNGNLLPTK